MSDERVSVTVEAGIASVRLNRPGKLNAIDHAMFTALSEASAAVGPRRRAGRGAVGQRARFLRRARHRLAGGRGMPESIERRTHGIANLWQHAVWGWRELPVPVIAAVHGVAFGGGLQIALAADIRIVAPDARLAVMEARWGLVPDMAGIALLRGVVREDVARELTYTARQVSGTEAAALGLATRTADEPYAAAMALAAQVAAASPRAVRGAKRLFGLAQDAAAAQILLAESREQQALLAGPDLAEAIAAQAEGRAPRFAD